MAWVAPVPGAAGLEAVAFPPFELACPLAIPGAMHKAINRHEASIRRQEFLGESRIFSPL